MKKGTRIMLTVLGVILAAMSLLLLIATPAGIVGLVISALIFFVVWKDKKAEKKLNDEIEEGRKRAASLVLVETIPVVGTKYYMDNIEELLTPNDEYKHPKDHDETYMKYEEYFEPCKLVPEPDNQQDPNAIRVESEDLLVGYIPRDKQEKTRTFMNGKYKLMLSIDEGPYKEYDEDEGKWIVTDERLQTRVFIEEYKYAES